MYTIWKAENIWNWLISTEREQKNKQQICNTAYTNPQSHHSWRYGANVIRDFSQNLEIYLNFCWSKFSWSQKKQNRVQKNVLSAPSTLCYYWYCCYCWNNTEYYSDIFTHIHIWFVCCIKNEPIRYHSALWWSHVISLQKNLNYIYRKNQHTFYVKQKHSHIHTKQKTNHFIYIRKTCKRYNLHDFVLQSLIDRHAHTTEWARAQTHGNIHTHTGPLCIDFISRVNERTNKEAKQNTEKYT